MLQIKTALPEIETTLQEIDTALLQIEIHLGHNLVLRQGGLDLQQVGKILIGSRKNVLQFICVKCPKLAWFSFDISNLIT